MDFREWLLSEKAEGRVIPKRFIRNGTLDLYHFTPLRPNKFGFVKLDPIQAARNPSIYSAAEYRASSYPRVFYYLNPKDVDKDMGRSLFSFLYKTKVNAAEVYPLKDDPMNLHVGNLTQYLANIHDNGFKGTYYNTGGFNVVALFEPVMAQLIELPVGMAPGKFKLPKAM